VSGQHTHGAPLLTHSAKMGRPVKHTASFLEAIWHDGTTPSAHSHGHPCASALILARKEPSQQYAYLGSISQVEMTRPSHASRSANISSCLPAEVRPEATSPKSPSSTSATTTDTGATPATNTSSTSTASSTVAPGDLAPDLASKLDQIRAAHDLQRKEASMTATQSAAPSLASTMRAQPPAAAATSLSASHLSTAPRGSAAPPTVPSLGAVSAAHNVSGQQHQAGGRSASPHKTPAPGPSLTTPRQAVTTSTSGSVPAPAPCSGTAGTASHPSVPSFRSASVAGSPEAGSGLLLSSREDMSAYRTQQSTGGLEAASTTGAAVSHVQAGSRALGTTSVGVAAVHSASAGLGRFSDSMLAVVKAESASSSALNSGETVHPLRSAAAVAAQNLQPHMMHHSRGPSDASAASTSLETSPYMGSSQRQLQPGSTSSSTGRGGGGGTGGGAPSTKDALQVAGHELGQPTGAYGKASNASRTSPSRLGRAALGPSSQQQQQQQLVSQGGKPGHPSPPLAPQPPQLPPSHSHTKHQSDPQVPLPPGSVPSAGTAAALSASSTNSNSSNPVPSSGSAATGNSQGGGSHSNNSSLRRPPVGPSSGSEPGHGGTAGGTALGPRTARAAINLSGPTTQVAALDMHQLQTTGSSLSSLTASSTAQLPNFHRQSSTGSTGASTGDEGWFTPRQELGKEGAEGAGGGAVVPMGSSLLNRPAAVSWNGRLGAPYSHSSDGTAPGGGGGTHHHPPLDRAKTQRLSKPGNGANTVSSSTAGVGQGGGDGGAHHHAQAVSNTSNTGSHTGHTWVNSGLPGHLSLYDMDMRTTAGSSSTGAGTTSAHSADLLAATRAAVLAAPMPPARSSYSGTTGHPLPPIGLGSPIGASSGGRDRMEHVMRPAPHRFSGSGVPTGPSQPASHTQTHTSEHHHLAASGPLPNAGSHGGGTGSHGTVSLPQIGKQPAQSKATMALRAAGQHESRLSGSGAATPSQTRLQR
jgi:hypothetical protein